MAVYVTTKLRDRLGSDPINGWSLNVAKKNGAQIDAEFVKDGAEPKLVVISGDALTVEASLRTMVEPHLG